MSTMHLHTPVPPSTAFTQIYSEACSAGVARRRFRISTIRSWFLTSQLNTYCIDLKHIHRGDHPLDQAQGATRLDEHLPIC